MRNYLKQCLNTMDIEITDKQLDNFMKYNELLLDWNTKINLTAITEPEEVVKKHFCDSVSCLSFIKNSATVCDVGTGAGFPGLPIAIMRDDVKVLLVDSLNKRIKFLNTVIEELGLKGYRVGDAEISTKHAGFIVNRGNATAEDVISVIEYTKDKVYEKYGVKLENEIEIIGEE